MAIYREPDETKYEPRPVTEEEYKKWLEWRDNYINHHRLRKEVAPNMNFPLIVAKLALQEKEAGGNMMDIHVQRKSEEIAENFHVLEDRDR